MWIMTSWGILMPSVRPAETIPEGDDKVIQIRARRYVELYRLKKMYMPKLGEIIFMPNTDYEYRVYCTHAELGEALVKISADIDYTKFKPTTEDYNDKELHSAYNAIWGILYDRFSTNRYLDKYAPPQKNTKTKKKRPEKWWQDAEHGQV